MEETVHRPLERIARWFWKDVLPTTLSLLGMALAMAWVNTAF